MKKIVLLALLFTYFSGYCQKPQSEFSDVNFKKINKGRVYILVGWNWERYTQSDMHFTGADHDFVLHNVMAEDRPFPFSANLYLNPANWTIPQTNLKVGYFFHNNWNVAFGLDHMKYVMTQYQDVTISGDINTGGVYDGSYDNDPITLDRNFLKLEHTDGLNYIHFEINRVDRIIETRFFDINITEGFSLGAVIPRSDVQLLANQEWDKYHLAGYGTGLKVGVNLTFFNYFHIQSEAKGGFIHMADVKTTPVKTDKANHHFFYFQHNIQFGAVFPIIRKEKRLPKSQKE